MKMKCGLLILALFIQIALHSTTPFSFHSLREGRRVKREECQHGDYVYKGEKCCKCPPGYYVKTNCGINVQTKCEPCQENTYYEKPNSGTECERCRSCNANVHQETEEKCTKLQNTKCRCMQGYWGVCQDNCQCHSCDKCEGHDILAPCTGTNNTVCGEPFGDIHHKWIVPVIVILLFLVLVLVLVLVLEFFWKRSGAGRSNPEEVPLVPGVDLSNHLYDIVEELGPQLVKQLAIGSGVRETQIEMRITEHPQNIKEQCYSILRDWYERKGLNQAFPELIRFLQRKGKKDNAERLKKLINPNPRETASVNMDNPEHPA
ncbi:tumor necrosis factor receptor superfamily member 6-like [Brienomyrus brachyistius]|uniref:tumor necrosis factor receptor superfamily member 6-like n=1 Tax=Brienomyrus brachyistius TaxID=42636 RepID=UPI0020B2F70E|nr:tumor necrosis factor receptor superfamily member 6-like [Brienomyrus brachyistius]